MNFNEHSELLGQHAFLSASKYHWINYTPEKLESTYLKFLAIKRGTELHDLASRLIVNKIRLPNKNLALNNFVNDAIHYNMASEQPLYYSRNLFGTADAIAYRRKVLRIFDLKTGESKPSMNQLHVYAVLFCLEYDFDPFEIGRIILRIYQGDKIFEEEPNPERIDQLIDKALHFDSVLNDIQDEMEA